MKTQKKGKDISTSDKQDCSRLGDTILNKSEALVPVSAALGWNQPTFLSQDV